ncbi:MAG: Ig-like domain repeat protein [Terriglobia bacterium]
MQVTVNVAGSGTLPAPQGTVTLNLGTYSETQTLASGSASFSIPGPLSSGAATLSATYSGDSNYTSGAGTASVTINVAPAGFSVSAAALSVMPGATTGNTSTITVTPAGGFTGNVTLSAVILSSPAGAVAQPTFSFGATSPVSITSTGSGTAILTVNTTNSASAALAPPAQPTTPLDIPGLFALAGLLLVAVPGWRRFCCRLCFGKGIAFACLWAGMMCAGLTGCGSSSISAISAPGTTPGNYLVQITGTSGSLTATGDLMLTVQ